MGLFDRFKRKKVPEPAAPALSISAPEALPEPDTKAVILLDQEIDWTAVSKTVAVHFDDQALAVNDLNVPNAPAMTFTLEGKEFFCSYFAILLP